MSAVYDIIPFGEEDTFIAPEKRPEHERMTNVEYVTHVMEEHPLIQSMVVEAIMRYTNKVANSTLDDYPKSKEGHCSLIDWELWIELGKKAHDMMCLKYGGAK